jgi:hypothetical protein
MKKNFVIALCAVCLCIASLATEKQSTSNAKASFDKFVEEGNKAQTSNDAKWLEANLAEGYVEGTSFGTWVSKAQLIKDANDPSALSRSEPPLAFQIDPPVFSWTHPGRELPTGQLEAACFKGLSVFRFSVQVELARGVG